MTTIHNHNNNNKQQPTNHNNNNHNTNYIHHHNNSTDTVTPARPLVGPPFSDPPLGDRGTKLRSTSGPETKWVSYAQSAYEEFGFQRV